MQKYCTDFPIGKMARVFKVSRAGYYRYINKKTSLREKKNQELFSQIRSIFEDSKRIYGSPRIHAVLKKQGIHCSRKRVAKIMKKNKIQSKIRKRWKPSNKSAKESFNAASNLVKQNFIVTEKNKIWVSDITYVNTTEGWLYVSAILDLYSRKIIGLSMGSRMDVDLVKRSLDQAICHRSPNMGLILHSDRGSQYTSHEYKNHTARHGIILSMNSKGNCYDNAAMESFFHTLKTEHIFFHHFKTRGEASQSIFEYVEVFYNRQRLHSTLHYLSPFEFEQHRSRKESRVKFALPAKEAKFRICYV